MPLYEFVCEQCGKESEILVRTSDWSGVTCPHCASPKLAKKFSVFATSGQDAPASAPSCTGTPTSCGRCGTGVPHRH